MISPRPVAFTGAIIVLTVAVALDWSGWLVGAAILAAAATLVDIPAVAHRLRDLPRTGPLRDDVAEPMRHPEPTLPPQMRCQLPAVGLPTAIPAFTVIFSATVHWRELNDTGSVSYLDAPALARHAVLQRAARLTSTESPEEVEFVKHRLAADLGLPMRDETSSLEAWASDISLTLPAGDTERLRVIAEARKDDEVWEQERRYERSRRQYLGDDVLKSPGSAVVWWLARDTRDSSQLTEAVALIGALAQLSSAANDIPVPPLYQPHLGNGAHPDPYAAAEPPQWAPPPASPAVALVEHVANGSSEHRRAMFSSDLATLLDSYDSRDDAQQIRNRYNAPDFTAPGEPDPPPSTATPDM